jgi:selenide, water dikinase
VQTIDFFTPIVDDPYDYGQIAAANAMSDVYAMGGRPLTALNLLAVPPDRVPPAVIAQILKGGAAKAREAGCTILGGHTIRNPEPLYGMAVTGLIHPKKILTNAGARAGDLLVLTKPLGTGVATTGIKRKLASAALARRVTRIMSMLNTAGPDLAEKRLVRAATDVTGFGLLGHLANICRASGVGAEIQADKVPILSREILSLIDQDCIPAGSRDNLGSANEITRWHSTPDRLKYILIDAQTSGGLLLCAPPRQLMRILRLLKSHHTPAAAIIGRIVGARRPLISVS